jgi:Ca-activated chloride channel family protein
VSWLPEHFIRPAWLLAAPLCILVPLLWRRLRRPSGDWARVCDPHLLRWLSVGDAARTDRGFGALVAGLVILLSTLALAGPSWQQLPDQSYTAQDSRVIVMDLSQSMLAEDLKPNRLTRVRFRLSDLLNDSAEGQIGMVAFAGDAYVVAPLTNDTNTVANMLPALRPDVVPVAGSRADRGLELAAELIRRSSVGGGEILLVTDDAEPRDAALAAEFARQGLVVSVLAVGTSGGAPIPSGNGFVSDRNGAVVIARTAFDALEAVAQAGGGKMTVLDSGSRDESPWRSDTGTDFALRDDGAGERWADSGPWLLLALLPLVAVGFRRGLLFCLVLMMSPLLMVAPSPAQAGVWDDLWKRKDQQAQEALQRSEPEAAAALATDPAIAGEAWYRSGDYARAAQAWAANGEAEAWYNRGNALALAGKLDAAINAYDEALQRQPEWEDAIYNKALIEQLKQEQEEQESENQEGEGEDQEGQPQDSEQEGEQGDSQSDSESEGEPGEEEQQEAEGEQGEQSEAERQEQMAQAWSEEDAQAMEQWLRRIPDDPGGLLRRKFRNEHQRRGAPPDETKTW